MFNRYGSIATKNNNTIFKKTVTGLLWLIFDIISLDPHQITTRMMKLRLNNTRLPTTSMIVSGLAFVKDNAPTARANPNTAVVNFSVGESCSISHQSMYGMTPRKALSPKKIIQEEWT